MNSKICDLLGIEFPLFAFSHCRDVIAEVSNAGGFGVLGAAGHTPETLDIELTWIDEHVNGKPYGVDLLVPTSMDNKDQGLSKEELEDRIPTEHKRYIEGLLAQHDIDTGDLWTGVIRGGVGDNMRQAGATEIRDSDQKLRQEALYEHNVPLTVFFGLCSRQCRLASLEFS